MIPTTMRRSTEDIPPRTTVREETAGNCWMNSRPRVNFRLDPAAPTARAPPEEDCRGTGRAPPEFSWRNGGSELREFAGAVPRGAQEFRCRAASPKFFCACRARRRLPVACGYVGPGSQTPIRSVEDGEPELTNRRCGRIEHDSGLPRGRASRLTPSPPLRRLPSCEITREGGACSRHLHGQ